MTTRRPVPSIHRGLVATLVVALMAIGCSTSTDEGTDSASTVATTSSTEGEAPSTETAPDTGQDSDGSDPSSADQAGTDGEATGFEVAPAAWEGCDGGLECAIVTVPLDHGDVEGPTIELALIRVPSTDDDGDGVQGSILVNPGGPGGSGVNTIRSGFRFDPDTMDDYHLVGFDPRGVGQSTSLSCGPEPTGEPLPDYEPDDAEERAELDDAAAAFAQRCQQLDGDLLPHLATDAVVADLDLLRQAVGDEKLSYLGLSYGTLIGLRYAEAYPDRVGRLILDSVVDPATTLSGLLAQQAEGFDRVFAAADEACQATSSCPDDGLGAAYDRVAQRLDEAPIDGVGPTELAIGTLIGLYDESLWPRYAQALADADDGDVGGIRTFYGIYAGAADEAAYLAVVCTDSPVPAGGDAWDRLADQLEQRSPRFGAVLANEVRACAHWPVRDTTAPEAVTTEGLPPILVLSTIGDAATPVENAVTVAAGLDGATLVTVDDTSHIAYGRNFCVNQIVADYLATGEVPAAIQRC